MPVRGVRVGLSSKKKVTLRVELAVVSGFEAGSSKIQKGQCQVHRRPSARRMKSRLCLVLLLTLSVATVQGQYFYRSAQDVMGIYFDQDLETAGNTTNSTTSDCPHQPSTWLGFVCAAVSVVFFGINFLPVKKIETGDGMFFQWIVCMGIWLSGLVIYAIRGFPKFQPLAMVGGLLWATGNITVVPIVKMIGLGMGLLIWGLANLLFGWASARFGILGITKPEIPCSKLLNDLGIVFCVLGLMLYFFVKTEPQPLPSEPDESTHLLAGSGRLSVQRMDSGQDDDASWTDKIKNPMVKKAVAIGMSLFAGALYGVNFNPVTHLEENVTLHGLEPSTYVSLDFVFPHFCGILATSSIYFFLYCAVMKSSPRVYPKCILPGLMSGVMWAIADASWFIANEKLSQAVAFPLITTGPGLVGAVVGIIFFGEIKGKRNFVFLGCAFLMTIIGVAQVAVSKIVHV
eukprot:scpid60302/ scgid6022/ Transmembrane protein 144